MPQTSGSYTTTLPNGNRVTVRVGGNRSGFYKTVTLRRRDGSSNSRTYRRGRLLAYLVGPYSDSIPRWARDPIPGQPPKQRRARATKRAASKPPEPSRTRPGGLNHEGAYAVLAAEIVAGLDAAVSPQAIDEVITRAGDAIRREAGTVPEFYVGEFFDRLNSAIMERMNIEVKKCEEVIASVQAQADVGSLDLNTRLSVARQEHDQDAEHAIWRERDLKQAEIQGTIDSATSRITLVAMWPTAIKRLASHMGVKLG